MIFRRGSCNGYWSKKTSNQENIVFAYNAAGKLIEEYSGSTLQTAYVYAGSRLLTTETATGTSYLTNDRLGSPRINTDQTGSVTARHDYHPFGEEIFAIGGRTAGLGYASDNVTKQFTGYERDSEIDLDFAQARYYNSQHGRFTSTDPILMSDERAFDPQQINLYAYARNNPYKYVDPTGEDIDDSSLKDNEDYQKWKKAFLATKDGQKLWDKYQNDKNFKLIINMSKDKKNGAETLDYKFSDGKLVGATIVLGNKLDDVSTGRSKDAYPITEALSEAGVNGTTMAVAKIAHEFGHVEDASNRADLFRASQESRDLLNKRAAAVGLQPALAEPAVQASRNVLLKKSGFSDFTQFDNDKDRRAEGVMIPVIQQHFANNGKKTPGTVQKAIDKFLGNTKK